MVTSSTRREATLAYLNSLANLTDREIQELGRRQHPDWHDLDIADWAVSKRQYRVEAAGILDFSGWSAVIDRIDCPTLLIHGDPDRGGIVTPALAERLALSNARITARLVEDSGHNIRRQNFSQYCEVLDEFLASP